MQCGRSDRRLSGWLCMFFGSYVSRDISSAPIGLRVRADVRGNTPRRSFLMAGCDGLMMFDFIILREQMCVIACPYGRFQSVMLRRAIEDRHLQMPVSRWNARAKGNVPRSNRSAIVVRFATNACRVSDLASIFARGLQMECINCTQCIDACPDSVIAKRLGLRAG